MATVKNPRTEGAVIRAARKQLEIRTKAVAAERDKLRDLESELGELADSCDDALEALQTAIETLSKYA